MLCRFSKLQGAAWRQASGCAELAALWRCRGSKGQHGTPVGARNVQHLKHSRAGAHLVPWKASTRPLPTLGGTADSCSTAVGRSAGFMPRSATQPVRLGSCNGRVGEQRRG